VASTDPQPRDREPAIEWAHPGQHMWFDYGEADAGVDEPGVADGLVDRHHVVGEQVLGTGGRR
jgi:hypothetical protein